MIGLNLDGVIRTVAGLPELSSRKSENKYPFGVSFVQGEGDGVKQRAKHVKINFTKTLTILYVFYTVRPT